MKLFEYCATRGKQAELSRETGLSPVFINQIVKGSKKVPVAAAARIEKATGGVVTRKDMFPDDWQKIWPELAE